MPCSWIHISLCSFFFTSICIVHAFSLPNNSTVSYTDHCSSIVPQSTPTNCTSKTFIPCFITPHFTGGDKLLARKAGNQTNNNVGKSLLLELQPNFCDTDTNGIYKVEALLYVVYAFPFFYQSVQNSGPFYQKDRDQDAIKFLLEGFWSQISGNLCMVGSAYLEVEGGHVINLDAVLKLNYAADDNPTISTSLISGTLDSVSSADDPGYFDPILIYSFPVFPNYSYSLVPREINGVFLNDYVSPKDRSLSLQSTSFCSVVETEQPFLELEYAVECREHQRCSPLDSGSSKFLPPFLSLFPLQCCEGERKLRYLAKFRHDDFAYNKTFRLDWTLIVEASWDDETNQLFGVACRILNPADHFGNAVGDCSMRFSLRYPSILNIKNDAKIVGQMWSSKTVDDSGYFRKIDLSDTNENRLVDFRGIRYEYTELERVRKLCPVKKAVKNGKTYSIGNSSSMSTVGFDVFLKGEKCGWGFAEPLFAGNAVFEVDSTAPPEPMIRSENPPLNMSYKISINLFSEVNWSKNPHHKVVITAEGVYDSATGYLCMVGCRKVMMTHIQISSAYVSRDCEILVKFEFAPLNNMGSFLMGTIESTRDKADPLHFPDLSMSSGSHDFGVTLSSTWRLSSELSMLVVSNTLSCIFVWLQLRHVRRNPEVPSSISLVMILILSIGHMISVAFNFEALFSGNHNKESFLVRYEERLKTDKITSMLISMVEFLFHIRLFYVVWTAKSNERHSKHKHWTREKTAFFVSVSLYISCALLNSNTNIRYAGLLLDAFLLPQILVNILRGSGSAEKALSAAFYIGMSTVRLAPHAYNQYRKHNYPTSFNVQEKYYYANPAAEFYSTAWDIIIPFGIVVLVVIVFLQQRHGGRSLSSSKIQRSAPVDNE